MKSVKELVELCIGDAIDNGETFSKMDVYDVVKEIRGSVGTNSQTVFEHVKEIMRDVPTRALKVHGKLLYVPRPADAEIAEEDAPFFLHCSFPAVPDAACTNQIRT